MFEDLRELAGRTAWSDWPDCGELNALLADRVSTATGKSIRFSPQDHTLPLPGMSYEERIFHTGVVSTRCGNWHDLFNALMWVQWPGLKAAMNAAHCRGPAPGKGTNRSRLRDAITLLDESGLVVAASDRAHLEALREHQWKTLLFWDRGQWNRSIRTFIVGHALYEKALKPYPGMTGRSLLVQVDPDFFSLEPKLRYEVLDRHAASLLTGSPVPKTPRELGVLPLFGVPGWNSNKPDEAFYEDPWVFRPRENPARSPGPIITRCALTA
jgi:hypothetical protein